MQTKPHSAETVFAELLEKFQREQKAIAAGTFSTAGGTINCLVTLFWPKNSCCYPARTSYPVPVC